MQRLNVFFLTDFLKQTDFLFFLNRQLKLKFFNKISQKLNWQQNENEKEILFMFLTSKNKLSHC